MPNNVKDFGAAGDGIADDRQAIQKAIDDAVANDRGGIVFPPGTYRVSRVTVPGSRWSLDLNSVQDFIVLGEGPKSVVKLIDTTSATGDWNVFILRNNCRRVVFKDLVVDGNRTGLTEPDEQSHGVEVESGTEDLVIDRCIVRECFGDGVRLLGTDQADKIVRLRPIRERDPMPVERRRRRPGQHDRRDCCLRAGRVHTLRVFRHGSDLGAGQ
jgi:hypothetical protein